MKKIKYALLAVAMLLGSSVVNAVQAQNLEQIRWKTTTQVQAILGTPLSKSTPIGTHASYQLWTYDTFIVAFANQRAFHLFSKDALAKTQLNQG